MTKKHYEKQRTFIDTETTSFHIKSLVELSSTTQQIHSEERAIKSQLLQPPNVLSQYIVEFPQEPEEKAEKCLQLVIEAGDSGFGEEIGKGRPWNREKLEANLTNIYSALEWCFRHEPAKAVTIVERITTFLGDTGRKYEQIDYCKRAIDVARNQHMRLSTIGLLARLGWNYIVNGRYGVAQRYLTEAKQLIEAYDFVGGEADGVYLRHIQVLRDLGHLYARQGLYSHSLELIKASGFMAQKLNDKLPRLQAELFYAWTLCLRAENTEAPESYIEAKPILEQNLDSLDKFPRQLTLALRLLGEIAFAERRFEDAFGYLTQASKNCEQRYFKAPEFIALAITWGHYYRRVIGDLQRSVEYYRIARDFALGWEMEQEASRAHRFLTETFADRSFPVIDLKPRAQNNLLLHNTYAIIPTSEDTPAHVLIGNTMEKEPGGYFEQHRQPTIVGETRNLLHAFLSNLEKLSEDDRRELLHEAEEALDIGNGGHIDPLPEEAQTAITTVIAEIRNKPRGIKEDTKFEHALALFLQAGNRGVSVEQFAQIFEITENDERSYNALVNRLHRLRKKLEKYGYTIHRRNVFYLNVQS